RLHMIADNARVDLETRAVLLGDSREHDFRALLRGLRERVVDATGLLEDGSALGVQGEVQGRMIDSEEFRPLPVPADKAKATPPPAQAQSHPDAAAAPVAASGQAKIVPAPDL